MILKDRETETEAKTQTERERERERETAKKWICKDKQTDRQSDPATPWCDFKENCFKTKFGDLLTNLGVSERFQPATYTVFREESESEVQYIQIL